MGLVKEMTNEEKLKLINTLHETIKEYNEWEIEDEGVCYILCPYEGKVIDVLNELGHDPLSLLELGALDDPDDDIIDISHVGFELANWWCSKEGFMIKEDVEVSPGGSDVEVDSKDYSFDFGPNPRVVILTEGGIEYDCEPNVDDIVKCIMEEYSRSEVCLDEMLDTIAIHDVSTSNIVKIYARLFSIIEEDSVIRIAEGERIDLRDYKDSSKTYPEGTHLVIDSRYRKDIICNGLVFYGKDGAILGCETYEEVEEVDFDVLDDKEVIECHGKDKCEECSIDHCNLRVEE